MVYKFVNEIKYLSELLDKYTRSKVTKFSETDNYTKVTFLFPDESDTIDFVPVIIWNKFKELI